MYQKSNPVLLAFTELSPTSGAYSWPKGPPFAGTILSYLHGYSFGYMSKLPLGQISTIEISVRTI